MTTTLCEHCLATSLPSPPCGCVPPSPAETVDMTHGQTLHSCYDPSLQGPYNDSLHHHLFRFCHNCCQGDVHSCQQTISECSRMWVGLFAARTVAMMVQCPPKQHTEWGRLLKIPPPVYTSIQACGTLLSLMLYAV